MVNSNNTNQNTVYKKKVIACKNCLWKSNLPDVTLASAMRLPETKDRMAGSTTTGGFFPEFETTKSSEGKILQVEPSSSCHPATLLTTSLPGIKRNKNGGISLLFPPEATPPAPVRM